MYLHSEDLSVLYDDVSPEKKPELSAAAASADLEVAPSGRERSDTAGVTRRVTPTTNPIAPRLSKSEDSGAHDANKSFVTSPGHDRSPDTPDDYLSIVRRESIIADTMYIEMLDLLEEFFACRDDERVRRIERLVSLTEQLIDVCQRSNVILRKVLSLKNEQDTLAAHSLNTAILAVKIGLKREFTRERLFSLALCALLSDIGTTKVDSMILSKKGKLTPEEFNEITRHVHYSQEILTRECEEFPFLGPIVLQIHERENGSGYPMGLKGENIHEFAKIIGLCDVYIAMISRKAHREDFSGYATLQQIISRRGIDFSSQIIKSLIDVISVFPLESLIKLNNGAIGRVIDVSPVHPTRPKVLIIINSNGERLKSPTFVDLEKEPLLYVETPDVEEGVILRSGDIS